MKTKTVLHVGCGTREAGKLHSLFDKNHWKEIRLDIDPDVHPDIVASITNMNPVNDESVDAVYSSHNLEHLLYHEVQTCLAEFLRVLDPAGFALIAVPDLQAIAPLIAGDKLDETLYTSPAGPVAPIDMLYGFRPALKAGNYHMAHKTGFTPATLGKALMKAGFAWARFATDSGYSLWIKGYKRVPCQEVADQPIW